MSRAHSTEHSHDLDDKNDDSNDSNNGDENTRSSSYHGEDRASQFLMPPPPSRKPKKLPHKEKIPSTNTRYIRKYCDAFDETDSTELETRPSQRLRLQESWKVQPASTASSLAPVPAPTGGSTAITMVYNADDQNEIKEQNEEGNNSNECTKNDIETFNDIVMEENNDKHNVTGSTVTTMDKHSPKSATSVATSNSTNNNNEIAYESNKYQSNDENSMEGNSNRQSKSEDENSLGAICLSGESSMQSSYSIAAFPLRSTRSNSIDSKDRSSSIDLSVRSHALPQSSDNAPQLMDLSILSFDSSTASNSTFLSPILQSNESSTTIAEKNGTRPITHEDSRQQQEELQNLNEMDKDHQNEIAVSSSVNNNTTIRTVLIDNNMNVEAKKLQPTMVDIMVHAMNKRAPDVKNSNYNICNKLQNERTLKNEISHGNGGYRQQEEQDKKYSLIEDIEKDSLHSYIEQHPSQCQHQQKIYDADIDHDGIDNNDRNIETVEDSEIVEEESSIQEHSEDEKFDKPTIQTRFSDIIGHGHAKLRLDEMLLPLALPPCLAQSVLTGVRAAPASILLYGPPGTGKTQLAKAFAGEAQAAFMSIGPSDVLSKFVGESEQSIKTLFQEAREKAKRMESRCAVVFFDEIDALGMSRSSGGSENEGLMSSSGGEQSSRRVLAEMLIQLSKLSTPDNEDGNSSSDSEREITLVVGCDEGPFATKKNNRMAEKQNFDFSHNPNQSSSEKNDETNIADPISNQLSNVISPSSSLASPSQGPDKVNKKEQRTEAEPRLIVIAATNRPEDCDPALLRRFAIRVLIGLPNHRDRRRIITRLLDGIEHNITPQELRAVSESMEGWSGSDLESVTREAVMAPVRECLRSAAIMKMRARRRRRNSNMEESKSINNANENHEKNIIDRGNDIARDELLNRFQNLRHVSIADFDNAVSFWIGDGQREKMPNQIMNVCHYDSDSTVEEEDS